jgi:F-actin capping protein alpha subunit
MSVSSPVSAQDLLLSMPPLGTKDFSSVQSDLTKIVALNRKETVDKNAVAKEMQTRTCLQDENTSTDAFSVALTKCWAAHQEETYGKKDGVTARFTVLQQQEDDTTTREGGWMLRTYAEVLDTAKFRTGYWAGTWMIADAGDSKKVSVSGELSLHVYYYEGGSNVQMRGKREIPSSSVSVASSAGDADTDENEAKAKAIVEYIKSMEKSLHQDLSNDDELFLSSLPKIRRILPITKTRMKWNDAAQNQVRLLNARSSSSSKN